MSRSSSQSSESSLSLSRKSLLLAGEAEEWPRGDEAMSSVLGTVVVSCARGEIILDFLYATTSDSCHARETSFAKRKQCNVLQIAVLV